MVLIRPYVGPNLWNVSFYGIMQKKMIQKQLDE